MIALTGWGQAHDKQAAKDAGFDAHITKPADPDALCNTLLKLLKDRETSSDRGDHAIGRLIKTVSMAGENHGVETTPQGSAPRAGAG
jgi:DNA-binding response OmpR family regulator